ncbi:MAG TPA: flagellar hook-length control protein FliK [Rhodopila sp.]|uniref:flagellar hook-length control protein FliK n=1 Tax=Rhodopila sp. TaxID=2480087 RepID=UPI002C86C84F|nr:flagellar hook-length control protein FliK [Rhodopila sp.]HVY16216.1 flagellar hook-length control protein FliK [Rhodopila sp.]
MDFLSALRSVQNESDTVRGDAADQAFGQADAPGNTGTVFTLSPPWTGVRFANQATGSVDSAPPQRRMGLVGDRGTASPADGDATRNRETQTPAASGATVMLAQAMLSTAGAAVPAGVEPGSTTSTGSAGQVGAILAAPPRSSADDLTPAQGTMPPGRSARGAQGLAPSGTTTGQNAVPAKTLSSVPMASVPLTDAPTASLAVPQAPTTAHTTTQASETETVQRAPYPTEAAGTPPTVPAAPPAGVSSGPSTDTVSTAVQALASATVAPADPPTIPVKVETRGTETMTSPAQPADQVQPAVADRSDHRTSHDSGPRDQTDTQTPPTPPSFVADPLPAAAAPVTASATNTMPTPSVMAAPAPDLAASIHPQASPISQIAPALLTLDAGADGTQRLSLRLQPDALGTVEIRIDRTPDGAARVSVSADNPETLQLLSNAQSDLHKALDAAGIPAGRSMSFALGTEPRTLTGLADATPRVEGDDQATGQQQTGHGGSGHASGQGTGNVFSGGAGGGTMDTAGGGAGGSGQGSSSSTPRFQVTRDPLGTDPDDATESFQTQGI